MFAAASRPRQDVFVTEQTSEAYQNVLSIEGCIDYFTGYFICPEHISAEEITNVCLIKIYNRHCAD